MISYPQFIYDLFHIHHLHSSLSREHMNPQLTCSQRQWLHSSVGRASHRYREVTGSNPVEVLNFFQASLRNCRNCVHNCEDQPSFDFDYMFLLLQLDASVRQRHCFFVLSRKLKYTNLCFTLTFLLKCTPQ